ncbi:MAG: hypothetical protein P8J20_17045 [Novosphingobium sp.]|nr:hypothetical protein [Novosphingobium sp.]
MLKFPLALALVTAHALAIIAPANATPPAMPDCAALQRQFDDAWVHRDDMETRAAQNQSFTNDPGMGDYGLGEATDSLIIEKNRMQNNNCQIKDPTQNKWLPYKDRPLAQSYMLFIE